MAYEKWNNALICSAHDDPDWRAEESSSYTIKSTISERHENAFPNSKGRFREARES